MKNKNLDSMELIYTCFCGFKWLQRTYNSETKRIEISYVKARYNFEWNFVNEKYIVYDTKDQDNYTYFNSFEKAFKKAKEFNYNEQKMKL